jgi:hypothetical protein
VLAKPKRLGQAGTDLDSAAKVAAHQLSNNMTEIDQMGLISFNTAASLDSRLAFVGGDTNAANLARLSTAINNLGANGGTNISSGIMKAIQAYDTNGRSSVKHVAILLSDGYSQEPAFDIDAAGKAANKGITIFTIGMGMADFGSLGAIAHATGGDNFTAASVQELVDRYQQILKNVTDVVANRSAMDIISARSMVNGTITNDTEYVPRSATVYFVNGSSAQIEPTITCNGQNYTLSWEQGAIYCNQVWEVTYQLKAMHGGMITPISNYSSVRYTTSDGKPGTVTFASDSLFCQGNVSGRLSNASSTLSVKITAPEPDMNLTQLRQMVSWLVTYNGTDSYSQHVYIRPADSNEWLEIAQGFPGDRNSQGSYSYDWNLERMPPGTYTIRVFVTDGTYDDMDERTVKIPYNSGKITLQ